MKKTFKPLNYQFLRQILSFKELKFTTTDELQPLNQFLGQKRALEAVIFGVRIKSQGYNLYAMGPSGTGKFSLVKSILEEEAAKKIPPNDWCYIYNFETPEKPIALSLPAGLAMTLQKDVKTFIQELSTVILAAFESDDYRIKMQEILNEFNELREKACKKIVENTEHVKIPKLYRDRHRKENEIQAKYTAAALLPLITNLKNKYEQYPQIVLHLTAIEKDIVFHVNDLIKQDENNIFSFSLDNPLLMRYQINVLVNNENLLGAPVVFENNPSYSNLLCRVEHNIEYGAQVTNFMLIKAGSLHKANGGYLIIEARKMKKEKRAWEGLKQALFAQSISIEPLEHFNESTRPVSLEPMPIPLDIKVVLLGNRSNYYSLINDDPDFNELFKVIADFDEEIERNKNNIDLYARLIATIAKREGLRPFHASAVAEIIDHSTRIAQDKKKLSTHIRSIDDLIIESDYWASIDNEKFVKNVHVKQAIKSKIHRMDRTREIYYEEILRNFILINTNHSLIGQANCLSVVKVGKFSYGHPTRVTAKVRAGKGNLIDIQHEIDLAGPMHSKAGLTLSSFLASRYNENHLFSLAASISFEQIYGMMDGDSASIGELCALMSALSEIPVKQNIAVTGAIDQYGKALAIGGVNEKIEGFYDVCQMRKMQDPPSVIIPAVNIDNLMLREDIVKAAKEKKFFIYAVDHVDEAISILMGVPAGRREKNGEFTKDSINFHVENKLKQFIKIRTREKNIK